jgi:hypothetical protein
MIACVATNSGHYKNEACKEMKECNKKQIELDITIRWWNNKTS